jgi:hypothetical protein
VLDLAIVDIAGLNFALLKKGENTACTTTVTMDHGNALSMFVDVE